MHQFPLIDQYFETLLDMNISSLEPRSISVKESPRRLRCEPSYGFVHALLGVCYPDGRAAVSVTPGARSVVLDFLEHSPILTQNPFEQETFDRLVAQINLTRFQAGLSPTTRAYEALVFACNAKILKRYHQGDCRRLQDETIPPAEGMSLPTHCFPDGIVYGIVEDEQVVSVAHAHRSGKMEDQVADLGVETAAAYRQRGYAKTVVSAVTAHMTSTGGEAVYTCNPSNQASIATANSVGYEFYGRMMVVSAAAPE